MFAINKKKGKRKASPLETMINRICHKYGEMASIQGLHPHMYRHGIAIHMLENGVPIEIISKHLGHKSIETTVNFYAKISHEMVRKYVGERTSIN